MSRLKNLFKKDENKLIVFITAGFPKKKSTEDLVLQAIEGGCLLYTSPSPRDLSTSRMPSSA